MIYEIYGNGIETPLHMEVINADCTPKSFLLLYPRGAYTVFDSQVKNLSLDFHILRLIQSLITIFLLQDDDSSKDIIKNKKTLENHINQEWLMKELQECLNHRVQYQTHSAIWTILITIYKNLPVILLHSYTPSLTSQVQTTSDANKVGLDVLIYGTPRRHPTSKDSLWIQKRQYIDDLKTELKCQESILVDWNGNMYEGTTTNVIFIMNCQNEFILKTAPFDAVLPGSVSTCLRTICRDLRIPFKQEFVNVNDLPLVHAVLICNAVKRLKIVENLYIVEAKGEKKLKWSFNPHEHGVLEWIQRIDCELNKNWIV